MAELESEQQQQNQNWSEQVEDLVTAGDTDGAISLLEALVSKIDFETNPNAFPPEAVDHLRLASALTELANLYASKDFSLKSDQLLSRASLLKQHALPSGYTSPETEDVKEDFQEIKVTKSSNDFPRGDAVAVGTSADGCLEQSLKPLGDASPHEGSLEDDWEAIADRTPSELLSPESLPSVSKISSEDTKVQTSQRRGRGTFSYQKSELYSDHISDSPFVDKFEDEDWDQCKQQIAGARDSKYGTHHVLVLADFSPTTRTIDLERLFEGFKDCGVAIRWVNDTTALAVFQAPSIALEAQNHVQCPFPVRILEEDDILMSSLSTKAIHIFILCQSSASFLNLE
uniref:Coiled-coil domain-containing protein R3HCC1L isoform X1 n=1 Tax=Rhizophora mucronata TaxID=61149 RepID=A0A2P2L170_RHIMU